MVPPEKLEGTLERIVRLETKLDFLIAQLDRLPPSPACVSNHAEVNARLKSVEEEVDNRLTSLEAWRNRAVGAVMIIVVVFNLLTEKILSLLGLK